MPLFFPCLGRNFYNERHKSKDEVTTIMEYVSGKYFILSTLRQGVETFSDDLVEEAAPPFLLLLRVVFYPGG